MIISYNWLKEFVNFKESPKEIAEILLFLGLETTLIKKLSNEWENIITAKVLDVQKHPNADKLSICSLTDGKNNYSVVCGAPNVSKDQIVPLALVGALLPGNLKIGKVKIRSVESEGMICSEKELGLTEHSVGIMVLPHNVELGKPLREIMGDDDSLFEVEIATNRPDCLSHWGVAREIAASLGKKVKLPEIKTMKSDKNINISVKDYDLCPRYIGCLISGVEVKPSPSWLVKKLEKCGLRPINNIVDITNYVLLELGHPMHAFDIGRLKGEELIVKTANSGESILALDGKEYKLDDSMLVIADLEKPQAIAGIMGGEKSGVTEKTKTIILESAVFKPQSIRRTSRKLNLSSDSSYRFERGTGWTVAEIASWRAVNLIQELAGGILESRIDCFKNKFKNKKIDLRPKRVEHVLDLKISNKEIKNILENLSIKTKFGKGKFMAEVPSWRLDIKDEIDLIEELARIKGYDKIPTTVVPIIPNIKEEKIADSSENNLRKKLFGLGFWEVLNYSFCENEELSKFHLKSYNKIANPLSKENEELRPSLLPGLWKNLLLNFGEGKENIRLFETGTIFDEEGEKKAIGIIISGKAFNEWWGLESFKIPDFNFYFLHGLIMNLLPNNIKIEETNNDISFFHPGKSAKIILNNHNIGKFGILSPAITSELKLEVAYAEIYLEKLEKVYENVRPQYAKVIRNPFVKRDLSLVVPKGMGFSQIDKIINDFNAKSGILQNYQLFSVYEDESLGSEKISYSLHFTFRHPEHTLTDQEVNGLIDEILKRLKEIDVTLRA